MDPQQTAGFAGFLAQTDALSKMILAIMLVMSIATWYLIITKSVTIFLERRKSARFLDAFWDAPSLAAVERHIGESHPEEPFSHLAWHAISAHRHHLGHHQRSDSSKLAEAGSGAEFLTRAMRRVIDEDTARLESGLTVLASVGSTAPFVGLFGTVVGILNAFKGISQEKATGLAAVAGGISEALVTTAIGLFVAIPAVMMFNYLTGRVEAFDVEMDNSSSELIDYFLKRRGMRRS